MNSKFSGKYTSASHQIGGITSGNNVEKERLKNIDTSKKLPQVPLGDVYVKRNNKWEFLAKYCMDCNQILKDKTVLKKHRYVCEPPDRTNFGESYGRN